MFRVSNSFILKQLVPLTGWLPVPLPSQIRCITVPGGAITQFEVSPCKQYLILAKKTGDPQMWHIMSNTLVGTFKGECHILIVCFYWPKKTFYDNKIQYA